MKLQTKAAYIIIFSHVGYQCIANRGNYQVVISSYHQRIHAEIKGRLKPQLKYGTIFQEKVVYKL